MRNRYAESIYFNYSFMTLTKFVLICITILIGNDTIYWTDMGFNKISRARRDQTWKEDIITNGLGRVEGIAVDWIAGIFFTFYFSSFLQYICFNCKFIFKLDFKADILISSKHYN